MIRGRLQHRPDDDLDFDWLQDRLGRPLVLPVVLFVVASLLLFWALPPVSAPLSDEPVGTWSALGVLALCAGLVAALAARGLARSWPFRWQRVVVATLSLLGLGAGGWALARGGVDLFRRIGGLDLAFAASFAASFATGLLLLELAWPEADESSGSPDPGASPPRAPRSS